MMETLYFENENVRVSYDETTGLGTAVWQGFQSSEQFRSNGLKCLQLMNEKGLTRWLADSRKMKAIRLQDQQWVIEEFVPMLLSSPLRRMANLVSEDIFNKMAFEQMIRRSGDLGDFRLNEFEDKAAALDWLLQPLVLPVKSGI
ncbi:hypothetical protein WG947_15165 [Pontibacter sp. H259]|uniref:hypothetical protein n=1 Tax=Pontibacter sp. H259 TaxID=3133421 RepID=UPI0030C34851